jgi:hypothetical protein
MNFQRLAKKQTGLGPPSPTASGTGSFGVGSKAIYGLTGVLATTQLVRGATVSGTGIAVGSRIEEILNDTTIIIDTATTSPGLSVALTFDEIFPYGSLATDGYSLYLSDKLHRPIEIGIPIGTILAFHPRLFSASGNSGVDPADQTTLGTNYRLCDGSDITSTGSPLINGAYSYLPDLTDNRFLMGGINTPFLGDNFVYGGSNHSGPPTSNDNNGDNSITVGNDSLPPHIHNAGTFSVSGSGSTSSDGSHSHGFTAAFENGQNADNGGSGVSSALNSGSSTSPAGIHSHTISFSGGSVTGDTGDGAFLNNPISIIPKYLLVKYIMRIK